jgi:hypothetical protein
MLPGQLPQDSAPVKLPGDDEFSEFENSLIYSPSYRPDFTDEVNDEGPESGGPGSKRRRYD